MRRALKYVVVSVPVVAALAWLLYHVAPLRQLVVEPVAALLQTVWRIYQFIPSPMIWLAFIVVSYLLVSTSWLKNMGDWLAYRGRQAPAADPAERAAGRVATLARWVARRRRGPYSRHYLKNIVSEVAVEQLAQAHRLTAQQVKAALETNALQLPPEINAYLLAGLAPWPLEPMGGLRAWAASLGLKQAALPPDTETDAVLQFLEGQLDGPRLEQGNETAEPFKTSEV